MVTAKQRAWRKKFAARYGKKKKQRTRRVRAVNARRPRPMARRRRGRKGRRSTKKKLPLLPMLPAAVPAVMTYKAVGLTKAFPEYFVWQLTGYSPSSDAWNEAVVKRQLGLVVAGTVGHMIANKYINRKLPKWMPISL